jgi:hypothetical protein
VGNSNGRNFWYNRKSKVTHLGLFEWHLDFEGIKCS